MDKVLEFLIPPQPSREALEKLLLRVYLCLRARALPYVAVDGLGIRPVSFQCDNVEAVMLDKVLRDFSTSMVELGSAVGSVTQKDDVVLAQPVEVAGERFAGDRRQWFGSRANPVFQGRRHFGQALETLRH